MIPLGNKSLQIVNKPINDIGLQVPKPFPYFHCFKIYAHKKMLLTVKKRKTVSIMLILGIEHVRRIPLFLAKLLLEVYVSQIHILQICLRFPQSVNHSLVWVLTSFEVSHVVLLLMMGTGT